MGRLLSHTLLGPHSPQAKQGAFLIPNLRYEKQSQEGKQFDPSNSHCFSRDSGPGLGLPETLALLSLLSSAASPHLPSVSTWEESQVCREGAGE